MEQFSERIKSSPEFKYAFVAMYHWTSFMNAVKKKLSFQDIKSTILNN